MKTRHIVMIAGLPVAAWLALFGDKTPDGDVVAPTRVSSAMSPRPAVVASKQGRKNAEPVDIPALQPRAELIGGAPLSEGGTSLFSQQSWTPPPPPPTAPPPPPPPPPPAAPPLPFAYLGKQLKDGIWEVFLADGNQVFVAQEKAAIGTAYRVDAIHPPTMTFTHLPTSQTQTLAIGE